MERTEGSASRASRRSGETRGRTALARCSLYFSSFLSALHTLHGYGGAIVLRPLLQHCNDYCALLPSHGSNAVATSDFFCARMLRGCLAATQWLVSAATGFRSPESLNGPLDRRADMVAKANEVHHGNNVHGC